MAQGSRQARPAQSHLYPEAIKSFVTAKAIKLFGKYNVLSKEELDSRFEIYSEQYAMDINIEAQTAIQMVKRQYMPAAIKFMTQLGTSASVAGKACSVQKNLLAQVGKLADSAAKKLAKLESETAKAQGIDNAGKQATAYREKVLAALFALREDIDALEEIMPRDLWPVPAYSDMLFKL